MTHPTVTADPERVPTGRRVRQLTAQIEAAREGRGIGHVISEVWYVIVTVGLCATFVLGIASAIGDSIPDPGGPARLVTSELPAALVVLAAAGGLLSLAGRLGPVGVGGGGASWWLPMPIDRRGLLRPTVLRWPLSAALAGTVVAPLVVVGFGSTITAERLLGWAALGGTSFGALAAAALLLQSWHPTRRAGEQTDGAHQPTAASTRAEGSSSRTVAVVGEVTMLLATVGVAVLALTTGTATSPLSGLTWALGPAWWVAGPLAVAAVVGTWYAERRSDGLTGTQLRSHGSVGTRAMSAVLSLDLRELSRALTTSSLRARRARSLALAPGGPLRAILTADVVLLVRTPRQLAQLAVALLLGVALVRVPVLDGSLALYGTLLITGFWAVNAAAAGARHAEMAPVLDRLMPLSARDARLVRGAVPLIVAVTWGLVVMGSLAVQGVRDGGAVGGDESLWWFALVPAWAAVLAAAALRSAYRPPPNWGKIPVSTPMGGLPPTGGLLRGLDLALVCTLPTALALFLGTFTPALVIAQWAFSALGVAGLVAFSGRREDARV